MHSLAILIFNFGHTNFYFNIQIEDAVIVILQIATCFLQNLIFAV